MHKINLWTNLQAKNVHEWSVQNKVKCFLPVEKNLYLGSFMGLVSKPLKIQINSCVYSMRWFDIKWYIAEVNGSQFRSIWWPVAYSTVKDSWDLFQKFFFYLRNKFLLFIFYISSRGAYRM